MNYRAAFCRSSIAVSRCLLIAGLVSMLSCSSKSPTGFNTWSFSGYVIDGLTQTPLAGAAIQYSNGEGSVVKATADQSGLFLINDLPFGDQTFHFTYSSTDSAKPRYTERYEIISGKLETSASIGEIGDVSQIIKLFPMNGKLSGKLIIKIRESLLTIPAKNALVRLLYKNSDMANAVPNTFEAATDSTGTFSFARLPVASGAILTAPNFIIDNIAYAPASMDSIFLFPDNTVDMGSIYLSAPDTTNWSMNLVASNVISKDGFGLTGIPVNITPYFVLSSLPDSASFEAIIDGGGSPDALVEIHGDTVFVDPTKDLEYNSLIGITLSGKDSSGNRILLNFGGLKKFRTVKGLIPVASNTWTSTGQPASEFKLFDTLWVKFSETLDTNLSKISWLDSAADNVIYGNGPKTNANVWIRKDTLFVQPDLRLSVDFGQTMGFKIVATGVDSVQCNAAIFKVKLIQNQYYVKWSNTKDQLGNIRSDFGTLEPVKLISNMPVSSITGISTIAGSTPPPDMTLDNVKLSGDTIIYQPSLRLASNASYGMSFNITFSNGIKRQNVLPVTWKTLSGIQILSVNNRAGGNYRIFSAWGDSLVVTFSKAIDTAATCPVRFRVNAKDVKGLTLRTSTVWGAAATKATIQFFDTLPTADFDASPAYIAGAVNTRAIDSVSFDLTTQDGEQAYKLQPGSGNIEVHTEAGLCPVYANILSGHDPVREVDVNESADGGIPADGSVQISFNRLIDTTQMKVREAATLAGIEEKSTGIRLPCTIQFSADERGLSIHPVMRLGIGKEYYVWLKSIPGKGIAGAAAINKNAGSYSGKGTGNRLLTNAFVTESPNIQMLSAVLSPDSNTASAVAGYALGISAGFQYAGVVGSQNTITDSSIRFVIAETAWNRNHSDSVEGYQLQVKKIDRYGVQTGWYTAIDSIPSIQWIPSQTNGMRKAQINLASEPFYNSLLTPDRDFSGNYYLNGAGLFNDSSQIQIRIRPYVGTGDPARGEVGLWSDSLVFVDNIAPCDSSFVGANNCANLSKGGVQVAEHASFVNTGTLPADTNYIEISFPEDMDPAGPAPSISFFYGPFSGTTPGAPLTALASGPKTGWVTARKFRIFVSVPTFDYSDGASGHGAFYNVSVAGCKDASGNVIASYGSNGPDASSDQTATGRVDRSVASSSQKQGSASVVGGFMPCD